MNIIQVLRQYNPKSMEQRGINLAVSLSTRDLREQLSPPFAPRRDRPGGSPRTNFGSMMMPVPHLSTSRRKLLTVFSPPLSFSAPFFLEGGKDGNDFDVSPESETMPRIIRRMFNAGNIQSWIMEQEMKSAISRYKRSESQFYPDSRFESMSNMRPCVERTRMKRTKEVAVASRMRPHML